METITSRDQRLVKDITAALMRPSAVALLRRPELNEPLRELFRADFLGTTRFNARSRRFEDPACFNRSAAMATEYEAYYQFVDPVTPKLWRRREPSPTHAAIRPDDLRRSEYYNDFLRRHAVEQGIDLYLWDDNRLCGDIRVWRRAGAPGIGEREALLLSALQPFLLAAFDLADAHADPQSKSAGELTCREASVLRLLARAASDKEIARALGISYWTVRTHVSNLLRKTGARNRVELAALAARHRD